MSLVVQVLCALFFIVELATEVLGLRHWALSWNIREALQVAASLGLILGAVSGLVLWRQTVRRMRDVERQVRAASGAFFEVMDQCFAEWGLTPSEREVALFAVRGYSNAEIAQTRGKSEATIKTQMNAVFRKAGVTGRAQLISQFVDVLIQTGPQAAPQARAVGTGQDTCTLPASVADIRPETHTTAAPGAHNTAAPGAHKTAAPRAHNTAAPRARDAIAVRAAHEAAPVKAAPVKAAE